jgi:hypothetical protein
VSLQKQFCYLGKPFDEASNCTARGHHIVL